LKGDYLGVSLTNLCEYTLMTEAMKGEMENCAFWFKTGISYYEAHPN
jgi:hypothetical protein